MKQFLFFLSGFFLAFGLFAGMTRAEAQPQLVTESTTRLPIAGTNTPFVTSAPYARPTGTPMRENNPTAIPTQMIPGASVIDPVDVVKGIRLGMNGAIECWQCTPFSVRVRLTNYTPQAGGPSCWDWSKDFNYCMSETRSGLAWEEFYGLAAACDEGWPFGAWLQVEEVGTFICLDTGSDVKCTDGVCVVDVLGPGGAWWNQKEFDATLWVSFNPRPK